MSGVKGNDGLLSTISIEFSVMIVEYYKWLVDIHKEFVMSKQILRSGTSIGANIHEANFASSRLDFINKLQIALKEANETGYWLVVLEKTGFFEKRFEHIPQKLNFIRNLLIKSINTAKGNQ